MEDMKSYNVKSFKIFQKITIYELVGEVKAETEEQALELMKKNLHYGFALADLRDKYGNLKDETGTRAEIGDLVARRSPWYNPDRDKTES